MANFDKQSLDDSIPSYEESIAASPRRPTVQDKPARQTLQQKLRQERLRKITTLVAETVEPCLSQGLEDGLHRMSIVLLPSDAFPIDTTVTEASIVCPVLHSTTSLIRLCGDENRSSFLQQQAVVQEVSAAIHNALADPDLTQPQAQAALSQPLPVGNLPIRPASKSWLKRTFGMPPADHDPTGATGNWNLGWRSEESQTATHRILTVDALSIVTDLKEVSFRTESALGLLDSRTIKCLWIDVELPA